jgi:hypothetical protein
LKIDKTTLGIIEPFSNYQKIKILTELFLKQFRLQIIPISAIEQIKINNQEYDIENTLSMAYKLAPNYPLKTLDIIQLTSAFKMKLLQNRVISYFLTDDHQILDHADEIRRTIGFVPISSQDLVSTLKLPP